MEGAARRTGPAAACLKLVEAEQVRLCLSPEILAEMRDVLQRPKLRRRFPVLTPEWVDAVLGGLQRFPQILILDPVSFLARLVEERATPGS